MRPGHPPGMAGWGESDPGRGKDVFGTAESRALELRWSESEALMGPRWVTTMKSKYRGPLRL